MRSSQNKPTTWITKPRLILKRSQRRSNGGRYNSTNYPKRREQPNCLKHHGPQRSQGDVGQAQEHL